MGKKNYRPGGSAGKSLNTSLWNFRPLVYHFLADGVCLLSLAFAFSFASARPWGYAYKSRLSAGEEYFPCAAAV